ncbi:MAG TPA: acyl-CoA thioesterase [Chloroflexi bacterium]|nr:acyl-CoA thioesterase [Chloroflexota bacterium]
MSAFRFFQDITVRYGDLDPQGHVNNARYLTYLEQARIGYIQALGLWDGHSFFSIGFILATAEITYKAPILLGQKVRVGVRVSRLGNKSMTMVYAIQDGETGDELASAETVLVAYDYRTSATIPLPDRWREAIRRFEGL